MLRRRPSPRATQNSDFCPICSRLLHFRAGFAAPGAQGSDPVRKSPAHGAAVKEGGATGPRIAPSNVVISDKSVRNRDFGSHGARPGAEPGRSAVVPRGTGAFREAGTRPGPVGDAPPPDSICFSIRPVLLRMTPTHSTEGFVAGAALGVSIHRQESAPIPLFWGASRPLAVRSASHSGKAAGHGVARKQGGTSGFRCRLQKVGFGRFLAINRDFGSHADAQRPARCEEVRAKPGRSYLISDSLENQ